MYNIKTLNKIGKAGLDKLAAAGYKVADDVDEPDGIMVRSAAMHDYVFNKNLRAIARAGAGTNNIPLERCAEEGIVVFNTPGANANAVKELVICALMLASRDIIGGVDWVSGLTEDVSKQVEKGKSNFAGCEIEGKNLGVIGLGAIGIKVANIATKLGMTVYGYDPYISVDNAWSLSRATIHAPDLKTIWENCDYITIHVPYMESTKYMINKESIAQMRDGVKIINLARGELVNDDDILAALENGKVSRYVTDFPNENVVGKKGVIAIPHLGASTEESEENCARMAAEEMIDYLQNGNIKNSVNMPAVSMERSGTGRLCVIHRNQPNMLSAIINIVSGGNVNIENMTNKSRGDYAYTMLDVNAPVTEELRGQVKALEGVLRVRLI